MKSVVRVLLGPFDVVVALTAIDYALPSRYQVSRSMDIDPPPSKIHPFAAAIAAWERWSAWTSATRRSPWSMPDRRRRWGWRWTAWSAATSRSVWSI